MKYYSFSENSFNTNCALPIIVLFSINDQDVLQDNGLYQTNKLTLLVDLFDSFEAEYFEDIIVSYNDWMTKINAQRNLILDLFNRFVG